LFGYAPARERDNQISKGDKELYHVENGGMGQGEAYMLVQENLTNMQAKLSYRQDGQSPERCARIFQAKMLKGDVRGAVKYLTESEKGGVLLPDEIDE
jgi:hypothetical protein